MQRSGLVLPSTIWLLDKTSSRKPYPSFIIVCRVPVYVACLNFNIKNNTNALTQALPPCETRRYECTVKLPMANEAQLAAARSGADDIDVDGNGITGATSTLASTADAIQSRNVSGNHGSGTSTTTSVVADDGELEHERPAAADGPTHEVYTGLAETQDSENIQNGSTASGGVAPTFGVGAQGGISFRDDGADDVVVVGDTSNSFGTASHTAGSSTYTATEEIRDSLCDRRDEKQELLRGFETENSQVR